MASTRRSDVVQHVYALHGPGNGGQLAAARVLNATILRTSILAPVRRWITADVRDPLSRAALPPGQQVAHLTDVVTRGSA